MISNEGSSKRDCIIVNDRIYPLDWEDMEASVRRSLAGKTDEDGIIKAGIELWLNGFLKGICACAELSWKDLTAWERLRLAFGLPLSWVSRTTASVLARAWSRRRSAP